MKTLHLAHGLVYGGIERMLVAIAACRGHQTAMRSEVALCYSARLAAELRAAGATVHELGAARVSRPWSVIRARRALSRLLADGAYDVVVVHGNWSHALFGREARRRGIPLVAYAHATYGANDWTERIARRCGADLILANSQHTASSVGPAWGDVPCEVVRCPVPASVRDNPLDDRDEVRRRLDATPATTVVLMASRLDAYKGHDVLIAASRLVGEALPSAAFWVAGGPQTPAEHARFAELRRSAAGDLRIHWLGQRDDVATLMRAADVYCQPNVGPEPFGVAFVEALWAGLPVVTSSIGGGAEIVDDTCGRLTPPGDAAAVAAAIGELATDPALRARLAAAGPGRAQALCDPACQVSLLANLLADAVAARRAGQRATA